MFTSSSRVDESLRHVVSQLENEAVGQRVVAARVFQALGVEMEVEFSLSRPKPINILEEFILTAALEVMPSPTINQLAEAFGLDPVFLENECKGLSGLGMVEGGALPTIKITRKGQLSLKQKAIVRPDQRATVVVFWDSISNSFSLTLDTGETPYDGPRPEVPYLPGSKLTNETNILEKATSELELERLEPDLVRLGVHRPEDGCVVTSVAAIRSSRLVSRVLGVVVVHDAVDELTWLRVFDVVANRFLRSLEEEMEQAFDAGELDPVLFVTPEEGDSAELDTPADEPIQYVSKVATVARKELSLERDAKKRDEAEESKLQETRPRVEWLTDAEIRPRFLEALGGAEEDIVIMSPWVSEKVLDDEFVMLLQKRAQRGVLTVMGWGIESAETEDSRRHGTSMMQRLKSVETPTGVGAVALVWVGNQHRKEVFVDRKVHMLGSHNWLSYRGDWRVRGESIYYVELPETVAAAISYNEELLLKALDRDWKRLATDRGTRNRCLIGWAALRREEIALERVKKLLDEGEHRYEYGVESLVFLSRCLQGKGSTGERFKAVEENVTKMRRAYGFVNEKVPS